jgi:hypothetical protein
VIDNLSDVVKGIAEWVVSDVFPEVGMKLLEGESRDGQEPTVEAFRQQAREADAKVTTNQATTLTSTDKKALEKEFWETL